MLEKGEAKKCSIFSRIKDKNLACLKSANHVFCANKIFLIFAVCCSAFFLAQINVQTFINLIILNEVEIKEYRKLGLCSYKIILVFCDFKRGLRILNWPSFYL